MHENVATVWLEEDLSTFEAVSVKPVYGLISINQSSNFHFPCFDFIDLIPNVGIFCLIHADKSPRIALTQRDDDDVPDAVAGAAGDALDPEVRVPGADGNAVVAGADPGVVHRHMAGHVHVDPVGVGAVRRRLHRHPAHRHAVALQHHHVEQLAVHRPHAGYHHVPRVGDRQRLHALKQATKHGETS